MNILILGGTGTMGSHLTSILSKRGNICCVTSRSRRSNTDSIIYKHGNAHDSNFLNKVLKERKWDCIVDFMYYKTEEFKKKYIAFLQNAEQYIYISSCRVYANSENKITEDYPRILDTCGDNEFLSTDEYCLAKAKQENILRESNLKNWLIIRPYVTYAENTFQLSPIRKEFWLRRALRGQTIIFSKDLASKMTTFTYGKDVAEGIANLVGVYKANGFAYNITNQQVLTWGEILNIYRKCIYDITGINMKVLMIDNWEPILTGTKEQIKYDRLYNRTFDCSRISQYVDIKSFKKVEEGLKICLESFLKEKKWDSSVDWAREAVLDRKTKEWLPFSFFMKLKLREKIQYIVYRMGIKKF